MNAEWIERLARLYPHEAEYIRGLAAHAARKENGEDYLFETCVLMYRECKRLYNALKETDANLQKVRRDGGDG